MDEALERLAKEKGESVNVVAGRALRRLVEFDRLAEKVGLVMVSPVTLGKLMDSQTLEQARVLGESTAINVWKPMVLSNYGSASISSVLESIELISRYMGRFDFHYATEESKRVVTVRHSRGARWSAFYAGAAVTLFTSLGIETEVSETDELVSIGFEMPRKEQEKV